MTELNTLFEEAQKNNLKELISQLFHVMPTIPQELEQLKQEVDRLCKLHKDTTHNCKLEFTAHATDLEDIESKVRDIETQIQTMLNILEELNKGLDNIRENNINHKKQTKFLLFVSIILFVMVLFQLDIDSKTLTKIFLTLGSFLGGAF